MKKLLQIALFCAAAFTARGADIITATITLTNVPATADTIDDTSTRTFTNNVSASPGTLILATNTIPYSATNIWLHLATYPFRPADFVQITSPSNVTITAFPGQFPDVTLSAGWGTVTWSTNATHTNTWVVRVPYIVEAATNQTNIASLLVSYISDKSSNAIATGATALSNFVSVAANQTVTGNKTLTGTTTIYTLNATNGWLIAMSGISGYVVALTNGVYSGPTIVDGLISNIIANDLVVTNLSAPGSGSDSFQVGSGADASGDQSVAVGVFTIASGGNSVALGYNAGATKAGAVALGSGSAAIHTNAVAIGFFANTTTNDQIALGGTAASSVRIVGALDVANIRNAKFAGSVTNQARTSFPGLVFTTLGDGNNLAVDFGSNYWVRIEGTITADATICGLAGGYSGLTFEVYNGTAYNIIWAQNTLDPTPANRIVTRDGSDLTMATKGTVTIRWSSTDSRWHVLASYPTLTSATNALPYNDANATNFNAWANAADKVPITARGLSGSTNATFRVLDAAGALVSEIASNGSLLIGRGLALQSSNLVAHSSSTNYVPDFVMAEADLEASTGILNFLISTNRPLSGVGRVRRWSVTIWSGNTNRHLGFNTSWSFLGAPAPTLLASNKWAVLSLRCNGSSETNVLAAWSVTP